MDKKVRTLIFDPGYARWRDDQASIGLEVIRRRALRVYGSYNGFLDGLKIDIARKVSDCRRTTVLYQAFNNFSNTQITRLISQTGPEVSSVSFANTHHTAMMMLAPDVWCNNM